MNKSTDDNADGGLLQKLYLHSVVHNIRLISQVIVHSRYILIRNDKCLQKQSFKTSGCADSCMTKVAQDRFYCIVKVSIMRMLRHKWQMFPQTHIHMSFYSTVQENNQCN